MDFERFTVVRVPFPFTDRSATKNRPALVLSNAALFNTPVRHSVMAMITSQGNAPWPLDCPIRDLNAAGLPAPSVVVTTTANAIRIRAGAALVPNMGAAMNKLATRNRGNIPDSTQEMTCSLDSSSEAIVGINHFKVTAIRNPMVLPESSGVALPRISGRIVAEHIIQLSPRYTRKSPSVGASVGPGGSSEGEKS